MALLNPAIPALIRMNTLAWFRQIFRRVRTVKGGLVFVFGFGIWMLSMLPGMISMFFASGRRGGFRSISGSGLEQLEMIQHGIAFMLMLTCLTSLVFGKAGAIAFKASEVDFFFAGPFSRREALAYKLISLCLPMAPTALILSIFFPQFGARWLPAVIGIALAMILMILFGIAAKLVDLVVSARMGLRPGPYVAIAVLCAIAAALPKAMPAFLEYENFSTAFIEFIASPLVRIPLAPFEVFSNVIFARSLPDFALWGGLGLAINAALATLIIALDADYREVSIEVSAKVYDRIKRMRSGNMMQALGGPTKAQGRIPMLPFWGGAGPIAWRNLTTARRTASKFFLFALLILAPGLIGIAVAGSLSGEGNHVRSAVAWPLAGMATGMLTFMFAMSSNYDFRGDMNKMDWLKMLPFSPWGVVIGEFLAPTLLLTALQTAIIGTAATVTGAIEIAPAVPIAALPLNVSLLGISNFVFLLFPGPMKAMHAFDFQFMARMYLLMFLAAAVIGIPVAFGMTLFAISKSIWLSAAIAWFIAVAEAVMLVAATVWAFNGFDPSTEKPV